MAVGNYRTCSGGCVKALTGHVQYSKTGESGTNKPEDEAVFLIQMGWVEGFY